VPGWRADPGKVPASTPRSSQTAWLPSPAPSRSGRRQWTTTAARSHGRTRPGGLLTPLATQLAPKRASLACHGPGSAPGGPCRRPAGVAPLRGEPVSLLCDRLRQFGTDLDASSELTVYRFVRAVSHEALRQAAAAPGSGCPGHDRSSRSSRARGVIAGGLSPALSRSSSPVTMTASASSASATR
jgi:hypothetical protein